MSNLNAEFIERYQLEYQKNPRSRVFAPLAEAYRKMGLLDEARRICKNGVQVHPHFSGGRVAFAKVLLDLNETEEALEHLQAAIQASPDNLLAHSLLGATLLKLRRPKDALKAYKMVLFLNPNDEPARKAVQKWEFLTAEEFTDETFAMKPVFQLASAHPTFHAAADSSDNAPERLLERFSNSDPQRLTERAVSIADAFTVRNDLATALEVLEEARRLTGPKPEIDERLGRLRKRLQIFEPDPEGESEKTGARDPTLDLDWRTPSVSRRELLERLLRRISERRLES